MENRLKMRISRMFRSSFGSCRTRQFSDVMEKSVFAARQNHRSFQMIELLSLKARPFPSICRPKRSETSKTIDDSCIVSVKDSIPRKKVFEGRYCPPALPISPLNPIFENELRFAEKMNNSARNRRNTKKKKKKKNSQKRNKRRELFPFNPCAKDANIGGYWWYSGHEDDEEEDETDTLFSSKSLSSDTSRSRRRHRSRRKRHGDAQVGSGNRSSEMGILSLHGKVKDTYAVVKRSTDPYNDFRTSMVEMIVEKQIFAPKELENLLQCFLSLNSCHHHKIIVEVFTEIWEALFSDWF